MPCGGPRLRRNQKLNIVGERVEERRKALKLTRVALGGRIATASDRQWVPNEADIYKIENGRRSVHDVEVVVLAEALGCSLVWLLLGEATIV